MYVVIDSWSMNEQLIVVELGDPDIYGREVLLVSSAYDNLEISKEYDPLDFPMEKLVEHGVCTEKKYKELEEARKQQKSLREKELRLNKYLELKKEFES